MKLSIHTLTGVETIGNELRIRGEDGALRLSVYDRSILSVFYEHDVPTQGVNEAARRVSSWTAGTGNWDGTSRMEPQPWDAVAPGEETIVASKGELSVVIERPTALVSVRWRGNLVFGGQIGTTDTVLPSYPVRVRLLGDRLVGKMNIRLEPDDRFYGLGDKSGSLDKSHRRFKMFNRDALGYNGRYSDPLYKSIPFMIRWNPRTSVCCGVLFPAPSIQEIDLGVESEFYFSAEINRGPFGYLLFPGDNYREVLDSYTATTGRPALPPLFTFGFLGSSMAYAENGTAEKDIEAYFRHIEEHEVPCEGFYLSSGYTKHPDGKRYTLVWNREKFPQPREFLTRLADRGYRVCCNVKPGFLKSHPLYAEVAKRGYFIGDDNGGVFQEYYWGDSASFPALLQEDAYDWWKQRIKQEFLQNGVRGIWNDNNECEIEDETLSAATFRSTYPVRMAQASYEASLEERPGKRPWVVSRSGYAGIQRYARTWTGDNTSSFESLASNIWMGISLGLSGVPFYGHDVGGFYGEAPSRELLLRWCQAAVFHPRFVIHSWNPDGVPTEPWTYPDLTDRIVELIRLHYCFMPYIYNTAVESAQHGTPMERPLELEFPTSPAPSSRYAAYLFGPWVLALNVTEAGVERIDVALPGDGWWIDAQTGTAHRGGQIVAVEYPLKGIRYYVRCGSILPVAPGLARLETAFFDRVKFMLYPFDDRDPGGSDRRTTYSYLEDDGESLFGLSPFARYGLTLEWSGGGEHILEMALLDSSSPPEATLRSFTFSLPKGFRFVDATAGPQGHATLNRTDDQIVVQFQGTCPRLHVDIAGAYPQTV